MRALLPGEYLAAALEDVPATGFLDPVFLERLESVSTGLTLSEGQTTMLDLPLVEAP